MKRILLFALCFNFTVSNAQTDPLKWLRAFRITDYMVQLNDSTVVVQILPGDGTQLQEKQIGLARGIYQTQASDTVAKGYGRLQLIKGDYYYFAISHSESKVPIHGGDLLYTLVPQSPDSKGSLPRIALHRIVLNDVYDHPFYDSLRILNYWSDANEAKALDTMVKDIRFTADYFLKNQPAMNADITTGPYKGKKVLNVMLLADVNELKEFIGYIIARPRIYAGRNWKISEIYATWLVAGAPRVIK